MKRSKTIVGVVSKTTGKIATIIGSPIILGDKPAGIVWSVSTTRKWPGRLQARLDFGTRGGIYAYDTKGIVMLHRDPKAFGRDDCKNPQKLQNPKA